MHHRIFPSLPAILLSLGLAPCLLSSTAAEALKGEFSRQQLTDQFWAEGATFGDLNKDGQNDIVYGPYWWAGPDYTARTTFWDDTQKFKLKKPDGTEEAIPGFKGFLSGENAYSNNFITFTHDINKDGWLDIVVLGFPGKESWWFKNPAGKAQKWEQFVALDVTDNESPTFTDVTADGQPEIVCTSGGFIGYAAYDPAAPEQKWRWTAISPKGPWQKFTHGLGVGDVNGDGRKDLLEKDGWWEQPATLGDGVIWKKHEARFGEGGAQMYVYDVNGDGRNDVITSIAAHKYGVAWFEQIDDGGVIGWNKHMIVTDKPEDNAQGVVFSQPHAMELVDMNGDGILDLVTGKRFWAHGPKGDPDPNGTPYLYWFELQRAGGKATWTAHEIDNDSGVGTQVTVGDVNGDKKPDVVIGNKRGSFVFLRK